MEEGTYAQSLAAQLDASDSATKQSDFEQDFVNLCEELDPASDQFAEQSQRIENMFRQADEALKTIMEKGKASWNELKANNDALKEELCQKGRDMLEMEETFKKNLASKDAIIECKKSRNLALALKLIQAFKKHKAEVKSMEDRNKEMEAKVRDHLNGRSEEIEMLRRRHVETEKLVKASIDKGEAENEELRDQLSVAVLENQVLSKRLDIMMKKEATDSVPIAAHQLLKNEYEHVKNELREAKKHMKEGPKDYSQEYASLQAEHNQLLQSFEYVRAQYYCDGEEYRQALIDLEIARDDRDAALHFLEEEQNENLCLQYEIDSLKLSNSKSPSGFNALSCDFEKLSKENEEFKTELAKISQQADKLKGHLEKISQDNKELKAENEEMKANSSTLITSNERYRKAISTIQEEKRCLNDSVEALQQDISLKASMIAGQQEKIKGLEKEGQKEKIAELEAEVQKWKAKAKEFEAEKKQSQESLVKLKEDHSVLLKEITSQGGEDMTKVIEKLKAELAEAKKAMAFMRKNWEDELERFHNTKPGQKIQELQEEVKKLKSDLELMTRKRKEADDTTKAAKIQKGEFENEMMLSLKRVNEQEVIIAELEFKLQEALQKGEPKSKSPKDEVKAEKKDDKELEHLRSLVKILQSKVDKSEPLAEKNKKLHEDIALLEASVKNHKQLYNEAKANNTPLEKKVEQLKTQLQAREELSKELGVQYEKLKDQHDKLQLENVKLNNSLLAVDAQAMQQAKYKELFVEACEVKSALDMANDRMHHLELKLAVSISQNMCANTCLVSAWKGQQVMPSLVFAALQKEFPAQFGDIVKKIKGSKEIQVRFWRDVFGEAKAGKQEIATHTRVMKILDYIKGKGIAEFGPEPARLFSDNMDKNSKQILKFMCEKSNTPTNDIQSILKYAELEKTGLYYFAQATSMKQFSESVSFVNARSMADQVEQELLKSEIKGDVSDVDQSKLQNMREIFSEFAERLETFTDVDMVELDKKIDENFEEGYMALMDRLDKAKKNGERTPHSMLLKSDMLNTMQGEPIEKTVKLLTMGERLDEPKRDEKGGRPLDLDEPKRHEKEEPVMDLDEPKRHEKEEPVMDLDEPKRHEKEEPVMDLDELQATTKKLVDQANFKLCTRLHVDAEEFKPFQADPKSDEDEPLLARKSDGTEIKKPLCLSLSLKKKKK